MFSLSEVNAIDNNAENVFFKKSNFLLFQWQKFDIFFIFNNKIHFSFRSIIYL